MEWTGMLVVSLRGVLGKMSLFLAVKVSSLLGVCISFGHTQIGLF